jgi:hypothetical protein
LLLASCHEYFHFDLERGATVDKLVSPCLITEMHASYLFRNEKHRVTAAPHKVLFQEGVLEREGWELRQGVQGMRRVDLHTVWTYVSVVWVFTLIKL